LRVAELRRVVRFAVDRLAVVRRAVVLRPPRFAVVRFAVLRLAVLRFAVLRFAVALRRGVARFAVVFRPLLAVALRRVVLRPPPLVDEPLIGEGGGGVGLDGIGVGQTEPGSFCADQSVPWSSCMVPPQKSMERSRDAYRIPLCIASARIAVHRNHALWKKADEDFARQQAAPCREPRVTTRHPNEVRRLDLA
jgi:hypothetical protein